MCYAAQAVLNDRERQSRGSGNFCPVAMTAKQEMTSNGGNTTRRRNSGADLWKLKSRKPELFGQHPEGKTAVSETLPTGFEATSSPGWLYNPRQQIFVEESSGRSLWLDRRDAGTYQTLYVGEELLGATTATGAANVSVVESSGTTASGSQQAARSVVIGDFHKAAEVFGIDFEHVDRPSSMLAVCGGGVGKVPAEALAKALPERILRQLGSVRSQWSDEALKALMVQVLVSAGSVAGASSAEVVCSVALLLGGRVTIAAVGGASCAVAIGGASSSSSPATRLSSSEGSGVQVTCVRPAFAVGSVSVLVLSGNMCESSLESALLHGVRGRPRAASISLLHEPSPEPDSGKTSGKRARQPRAAACVRLSWSLPQGGLVAGGPASKRRRVDAGADERVRCRRILLKYVGCKQPTDQVRRRPVRRSLAEAENELLASLREAYAGGDAAFLRQIRAVSECTSSLKGGDNAGDAGWWTRPVEKPGERISREVASRNAIIKAAFQLEVGEFSDVIVSDEGAQILQRRA